jgi:hypothetical protein
MSRCNLNVKLPISHILQTVLMGYKKKKNKKKRQKSPHLLGQELLAERIQ